MNVSPVEVCQRVMKEYPSLLVLPLYPGYSVRPRYLPDVSPEVYAKAVYMRRALPVLAHSWRVERVRRSQQELLFPLEG